MDYLAEMLSGSGIPKQTPSPWTSTTVEAFKSRLKPMRDSLVNEFAELSKFETSHIELLWNDQMQYLDHLSQITRTEDKILTGARSKLAMARRVPLGRVLICIPVNAPIPLAAMLIAASGLAGNTSVLATSKRFTGFIDKFVECADDQLGVALFPGSPRDLIPDYLNNFDSVYFLGSSKSYAEIASACAGSGVDLVFQGEGNGFVYVSSSASDMLEEVVTLLLKAKSFCNGQMCSAPNTVLVERSLFKRFQDCWKANQHFFKTRPLFDCSSLRAQEWMQTNGVINSYDAPVLIPIYSERDIPDVELFAPALALLPVENLDSAIPIISDSKYRLQATYFGTNDQEWEKFSRLNVSRVVANKNPVDQDPLLPWGCNGKSGHCAVETLYESLSRIQLVEGGLDVRHTNN